jgi:hypothetical protein
MREYGLKYGVGEKSEADGTSVEKQFNLET